MSKTPTPRLSRRTRGGSSRPQVFQLSQQFLQHLPRSLEPVGGPDPVDRPSETFEHGLAEPVAVAGGGGAVIRGAVALDPQQVAPGRPRINDGQIDPEP